MEFVLEVDVNANPNLKVKEEGVKMNRCVAHHFTFWVLYKTSGTYDFICYGIIVTVTPKTHRLSGIFGVTDSICL